MLSFYYLAGPCSYLEHWKSLHQTLGPTEYKITISGQLLTHQLRIKIREKAMKCCQLSAILTPFTAS